MYRLVLYVLNILAIIALVFSLTGLLSINPLFLLLSYILFPLICVGINFIFAKLFSAVFNIESSIITGLILFLIFYPGTSLADFGLLFFASFIAMASKYVLAINKKHIFNPAAFAAALLYYTGIGGAVWWIGSDVFFPFMLIIGFLIVRKLRRFVMVGTFLFAATITFLLFGTIAGNTPFESLSSLYLSWPILFFATVMFTEPLTAPVTQKMRVVCALIVGVLFSFQVKLLFVSPTPETVLLIGNVFAFLVNPKVKAFLTLIEKRLIAKDTYEFVFSSPKRFLFTAGQYLEWTLPFYNMDSRGNRRYFTIASSPSESEIKLGVRFNTPSSSFKKKLLEMKTGDTIVGGQLAGDFVLPKDTSKKLVFIAGGIGVTPFRSIIECLIDTQEKRDVVLFYANKTEDEIAYKDIFEKASQSFGLKTVYLLSEEEHIPQNWNGEKGRVTEELIKKHVQDFTTRTFYLSGPNAMVDNYKKLLRVMGVSHTQIVTDYFPGF